MCIVPIVLTDMSREDLLLGTMRSLGRGGFDTFEIVVDDSGDSICGLRKCLETAVGNPGAWHLFCEDDIEVPLEFHEYILNNCRPREGIVSFYTCGAAERPDLGGWNRCPTPVSFRGCLCWSASHGLVKGLLDDWGIYGNAKSNEMVIARYCFDYNLPIWNRTPGFVRHAGIGRSTIWQNEESWEPLERNAKTVVVDCGRMSVEILA